MLPPPDRSQWACFGACSDQPTPLASKVNIFLCGAEGRILVVQPSLDEADRDPHPT